MDTISLWKRITPPGRSYPSLSEDIEVDVAIIGGGITGVTVASELLKAGKTVAIIESSVIGGYTTSYSTGNLYIPVQAYYHKIRSKFNLETARYVAQSRAAAIDYIERQVGERELNCHFERRPWILYTNEQKNISQLEKETEVMRKIGLDACYISDIPFDLPFKKAVLLDQQARFNPLKYVTAFAETLFEQGCLIYENTRIDYFEEKDGVIFKTPKGNVRARVGVMATHTPIGVNAVQFYTAPYRSYVVAFHLKDKEYPDYNLWDLSEPHHAISTHAIESSEPEILTIAGSHHKTGQSNDCEAHYQELEQFVKKNFAVGRMVYRWSAQHYQAADSIPYIGLAHRFAKYTYMATGYFADGLTYGTVGGLLLADIILGTATPWKKVYKANRFKPIASLPFLLKEGTNIMAQYLKDMPHPGGKYQQVKKGDAKVLDIKGRKCGVYRDEHNQLHVVSAVCTHMKCIVNWNNAEKTWDCPCHGSRFSKEGKVLEGPALDDLEKIKV